MIEVRDVVFTRAEARDRAAGLLGFARFRLGALLLDGVAVRRTLQGDLRLAFPTRRDSKGRAHPLVRPHGEQARRELERQIIGAIEVEELR